jgi:hypothetical protein
MTTGRGPRAGRPRATCAVNSRDLSPGTRDNFRNGVRNYDISAHCKLSYFPFRSYALRDGQHAAPGRVTHGPRPVVVL